MAQSPTSVKKISYARWPKSCWNLQVNTDEDEQGVRTPVGVFVMHVAEPDLKCWSWDQIVYTEEWVAAQYTCADSSEVEELLTLLREVKVDHCLVVPELTKKPKTIVLPVDLELLDLPSL